MVPALRVSPWYRHPKEDAFPLDQIKCPQKLCEVLELAERYQILALKTLAKEAVRDFVVTRKNIIFTATVAKNYKVMFDDIYETLSVKCLKFLHSTTENFDDMSFGHHGELPRGQPRHLT